ncbi:MAG: nucleotidyltransferase domain-containing protein [Deltaproteobacteria bacterium]|nr:MAG: nucleotidyltransferase domain-containing protein [Deltaproteobacteria bacterium]
MGESSTSPTIVSRWLQSLPALLRRRHVSAAYLFGSWARGDADALSDVDLIVVAPSTRPFVDRFRDYPELLRSPVGIDLLIYTPEEFSRERRRNRFVRHAVREARRLV